MKTKLCVLCILLLLCACASAEGLKIVATDFPCYDLATRIAGDAAQTDMLIKPGTEVHAYEPTPAEILSLSEAELFVCIGGESDVWVDGVLSSLGEEAPRTLRMMDAVSLLPEEGSETEMDEHIWTSPKNALKMLDAVENALCEVAPASAEIFHKNAAAYRDEIASLDAELTALIENARRDTIVVADRFPFLYLVHDYPLKYEAAFASCTAQTEPDAKTLMRLTGTIAENRIPVVYTIELSNGRVAQTLAAETGVGIRTLHSMQTVTLEEFEAGESYVSLMKKNLEALAEGLNG